MNLTAVRKYALSLPEVTEEPHHHFSSFRINGKIFATLPPEETHLHVFVDGEDRDRMTTYDSSTYEPLWWGKKVMGLRAKLATAKAVDVKELLRQAWKRKAAKSLQGASLPLR